jgi:hypothetical protein
VVRPVGPPPSFEALYAEVRALPHGSTGEILEPGVLRTMGRALDLAAWWLKPA